MKKTSKTVVFFGNERLATGVTTSTPTLKALIKSGYNIAAIVSNHRPSNSRTVRHLEVELFAREHNIPLLLPSNPLEISNQLKSFGASTGILVAYGKIVPQSIIDIFSNGIVNIHPSSLPLHRGPTPIESVILDGSTSTSVSLMRLVKAMDAGPVYEQTEVNLKGNESKQEIADNLGKVGSVMLMKLLPNIMSGELQPTDQQDSDATYDRLILKADGVIDWNKPAKMIEREVRAFSGWPGSKTILAGKECLITKSHVVQAAGEPGSLQTTSTELVVMTEKDGLSIDALKPSGKSEMDIKSFLAGYAKRL